jgi:hypothetical protein
MRERETKNYSCNLGYFYVRLLLYLVFVKVLEAQKLGESFGVIEFNFFAIQMRMIKSHVNFLVSLIFYNLGGWVRFSLSINGCSLNKAMTWVCMVFQFVCPYSGWKNWVEEKVRVERRQ